MAAPAVPSGVTVRPLRESEIPEADRIFRLAFGTFIGVPDPEHFAAGTDYIRTRWRAQPQSAFAAEYAGEFAGSNLATRWGSVAFFGPLTVRPDLWDKGIGKGLMEPVMECFARWGAVHTGLFTFANSPKHIHFYQKYGFWPRFLTAILSRPGGRQANGPEAIRYSALRPDQRAEAVAACRELTDSIFAGLDVTAEIASVATQGLGETVLLYDSSRLAGFAVCHCGPGTEAGSGACYVKFGAVRPGNTAKSRLEHLLDACGTLAAGQGLQRLIAGMNLARAGAYQTLVNCGFRADAQGVAMQRPNEPGYNRPEAYVIDDWR
jgi:predicted N-acetyltransferase YhbS